MKHVQDFALPMCGSLAASNTSRQSEARWVG